MGFWSDQLHYFDKGQFLISKGWGIYSCVVLLKLFNAPLRLYIVCSVLMIPVTWILGWLLDKTGIWAGYIRASNKGIKEWFHDRT